MDLNNQIFEMVEGMMKSETPNIDNLLVKMCLGNATEDEKHEFCEKNGIKTDISEQIQNIFEKGYKMAETQDKNLMNEDKLDEILSLLKNLDKRLQKVEAKLNIVQFIPPKQRNFDPDNLSQYL